MEYCLAAAALNAVDRRSLQRSARLGREVLERAKRRAVDWHSPERSRGCVGVLYGQDPYQERWSVPGPQSLLGEKYYSSMPEEGGATHVYRYHRRKPAEVHGCSGSGHREEQVRARRSPQHLRCLKVETLVWKSLWYFVLSAACVTQHCSAQQPHHGLRELPEIGDCLEREIIYFTLGSSVEPVVLGSGGLRQA